MPFPAAVRCGKDRLTVGQTDHSFTHGTATHNGDETITIWGPGEKGMGY